ncbi:MAG: hypothetical protein K6E78_00840, partial [Treponema sp.]|nr:hypothetical protein [Treponema sp.]
MPGLSQLKQFNSDILSLGSEPELRAKRGEKPVTFPLPKGIKDIDDSNDFVMGMPETVNNAPVKAKKEEPEDFSDIMGTASPKASASESAPQATESAGITLPDLSIINTSIPAGEGEDSGPDLSMFMDEEPEKEVIEEKPVERQIDEFSLDELLGGAGFDGSEGFDQDSYSEEDTENQDSESEISEAEEVTSDESVLNGRESSVSPLSGGDDFSMPDTSFGPAGGDLSATELEGETGSASSASGTKAFDDGLPASLEGLDFGNGNNEAGPDAGDSFGSDDLNSLLNGTDSASAGGLESLDASIGASGGAGISGSDFGLDIGGSADDSGFNGAESAETSFPDPSGADLSSDLKGDLDSSFDINDDELLSKAVSSSSLSSDGIEELDAMDFAPGDSFSADDLKELEESLPEDNLLNSLSDKENLNSDDTLGKMDAGLEGGDFSPENLSSDFSADGLASASEDFSADDIASSFNETDGGSPDADSSSAADSLSFDLPEGDFADLPSDFSDISSDKSDDNQASLDGASPDGTSFDSASLDGAASDGAASDFSMDDLTAGLPSDFSTSGDASDLTAGQDFELSEGLENSGPEEELS